MNKLLLTAAVIAAVSTSASAENRNQDTMGERLFNKWDSATQYNSFGDYSDRKVAAAEQAKQEAPVEKAKGKKKRMKKKAKAASTTTTTTTTKSVTTPAKK